LQMICHKSAVRNDEICDILATGVRKSEQSCLVFLTGITFDLCDLYPGYFKYCKPSPISIWVKKFDGAAHKLKIVPYP
jgi:hypothetical protein